VAILGAGRIRDQVVAREGRPVVRRVIPMSLSFDHRCITGGEATRFLMAVVNELQRST
jgi:pyruvate dehydrogenase E2 component (dihydrolipoamide acetyltransferase)